MLPTIESIKIADIIVEDRLRDIDESWAAAIAETVKDRGLDQPVTVRRAGVKFRLVAGAHRLRACALAGLERINANVRDLDDNEARIVEIDENLIRRELSPLDRAIFLAQRKAAWEKLNPETKHGGNRKSLKDGDDIKSQTLRLENRFTLDVAKKTGFSERTIQMAVNLLEGIAPDSIPLLRATGLSDNAAQIKLLALEKPKDQLKILKAIAAGEARNIRQARIFAGLASASERNKDEQEFQALQKIWDRSGSKARRMFMQANDLQWIDVEKTKAA